MQNSLNIVVGSTNPVKVNAVQACFSRLYPHHVVACHGVAAPSGVAEQPLSVDETLEGAQNRVTYCVQHNQADFYVAMEGGVDQFSYGPATFAYVVIADNQQRSVGRSAELPIPVSVYQSLCNGDELGPLMDKLFNTNNIKQKGGAIGLLTNGAETRASTYQQALTLAMAPFLHPHRF